MAEGLAQRIPYPALGDLVKWLEAEGVRYVIIGGLSVSIVSQPRPTIDVDLVVWLDPERWNVFLESGTRYGIKPREADALEFARKRRVLLLEHADTGIGIDVSFGALPFEQEMIDRATSVSIGGVDLRVATPEDLIVMKMIAHREKDLRDIDNIMRVCQELDLERIKYWLHEFALALETPELDSEFADMIQRHS